MQVNIAIATNINFYKKTIPVIVKSLVDAGIDKEYIFIFNGGFDKREEIVENGIKTIFLDHNSFEYAPLIDIAENKLKSDYWFLIHDTCKVGLNFKNILCSVVCDNPIKVALKTSPSMSIGLYKYDYILKYYDKLINIKNKDYSLEGLQRWKQWGIDSEDYLLWKHEPENTTLFNPDNSFTKIKQENWYGQSTVRIVEYYPQLDLYKNKSNWCPKSWMELNL